MMSNDDLPDRHTEHGSLLYRALVVVYCFVLATATGILGAGYFVEPGGVLARVGGGAYWLSLPLLVAVVIGAFVPPTPGSLLHAAGAVCLWFAMLFVSINLQPHTRDWFFRSRQHEFQSLADATVASGRIWSFWDRDRGVVMLNGALVAVSPNAPTDSSWHLEPIIPLDSALRRDGIDRAQYEELRRRLRSLHVGHLLMDHTYLFVGGRDEGYLYELRPSHPPQGDPLHARGWRVSAYSTEKLTDRWYYGARHR